MTAQKVQITEIILIRRRKTILKANLLYLILQATKESKWYIARDSMKYMLHYKSIVLSIKGVMEAGLQN